MEPPFDEWGCMPHDTFATLVNRKLLLASRNSAYLAIDRDFLGALLAPTLATIYIDEAWYLSHSPDVADAIARGEFTSAADHFAKVGYFEHRMPYAIEVDEPWYLEAYSDISAAVQQGVFPSGKAHFYKDGYREGRFPHANFTLRSWGEQK